ncbi:MAG TPA: KTSC domain-containing protein [Sideroxyarcus sp.]|nr:KTSC domain-containing protein [Sideroxyarcus sp.]
MRQSKIVENLKTMETKKINSGKLRAIGYDARARILQVQLDNGDTLQYCGVGEDMWRRLSSSSAAWSFYRDNIEEEFTVKKVSESAPAGKNPLDDLFDPE